MQDSLVGAVVDGRYAITARIGRGGMATVYRARDKRLERDIALKLMHPHLAEKPDLNTRFNKEARAAAQLASPYLVAIHDQGVWASPDGPRAYLVMEFMPGPDVRSELSRLGSFNLGTALALTDQVLRALAAAHDAGIIHRDVKPENILLRTALPEVSVFEPVEIQAKVADFGLAHVMDMDSASTGTILGTAAYIPPESVASGRFEPPSDLYSLGIVLYEFLTGTLPFKGETALQTAYMHMNEPMPRVSALADWLPPQVDSFIARLTAKAPEDRPSDARAALEEFERMRSSLPEESLFRRIPVIPLKPSPAAPLGDDKQDIEATQALNATERPTQALTQSPKATQQIPAAAQDKPRRARHRRSPSTTTAAEPPQQAAPTPTRRATPKKAETVTTAELEPPHSESKTPASATAQPTKTAGADAKKADNRHARSSKRRRRWLAALLALVLLGGAGGGGAWYFLDGPGKRVEMPSVVGEDADRAEDLLEAAGFKVAKSEAYSDDVAAGLVISSDPKGGSSLRINSSVSIVVSLGIEQVKVPSVLGKPQDEALATLEAARLKPETTEAYSEEVAQGLVVAQSIEPEASVNHDSPIQVTISKGREPMAVPTVVGTTRDEAVAAIQNTGLAPNASEAFSDSVPAGVVISQDPSEGTLFRGDPVSIVISKGPEIVEVPNVTDLPLDQAKKKIEGAGLKVEEYKPFGFTRLNQVWMQNPTGGTKVKSGSSVRLTIV